MTAVVVFESMFGNTEKIARAVADGIRSTLGATQDVTVSEVGGAPRDLPDDVRLLVVGGPTHAFGMTRPNTREDARRRVGDAVVSRGIGLREWLPTVTPGRPEVLAATFDTRADKVRHLPGSAARGAAKLLRRRGYRLLAEPHSFYVTDLEGPLASGEIENARSWGEQLGASYRAARSHSTA
jgi:flavodoxin-like protein